MTSFEPLINSLPLLSLLKTHQNLSHPHASPLPPPAPPTPPQKKKKKKKKERGRKLNAIMHVVINKMILMGVKVWESICLVQATQVSRNRIEPESICLAQATQVSRNRIEPESICLVQATQVSRNRIEPEFICLVQAKQVSRNRIEPESICLVQATQVSRNRIEPESICLACTSLQSAAVTTGLNHFTSQTRETSLTYFGALHLRG